MLNLVLVPAIAMFAAFVCYGCCCCLRRNVNNNQSQGSYVFDIATPTTHSPTSSLQPHPPTPPAVVIETTGLDEETIDSFPSMIIGDSGRMIKKDDNTCPICLAEYNPKEKLKILPLCLHRFHSDCIDQWFRCNGTCPICRILPPLAIL